MVQEKDGIHKPTKPFRVYYNPRLIQLDDIRKDLIKTTASWSHKNICVDVYKIQNNLIEWRCFECHTKINVDIKHFEGKSMFCSKHKPDRFDSRYKNNVVLMKYINTFFTKVKNKIKQNTNTELYG